VFEAFGEATEAVIEEIRAHSPLAVKVIDSWDNARRQIGGYLAISDIAYSQLRNRALGLG
jgi:hypothetical protein